ncbi:MAG: hypothetical protein J7L47_05345 [Candidatus Odinarchaeota archaeon]|nr:hypothetical protein [Candidatus Odinarchaeota archaeon]
MNLKEFEFHLPMIVFAIMILTHVYFCFAYSFPYLVPLSLLPTSLLIVYVIIAYRRWRRKNE